MSTTQTEFRGNFPQVRTVVPDTNFYEIPISQSTKSEGNKDTTVRRGLIALAIFSLMVVGLVVFGFVVIIQLQNEIKTMKVKMAHQGNHPTFEISRLNHSVELLLTAIRGFPKNCTTVNRHIAKRRNTTGGVFDIYPESEDKPAEVYCDLETDGGGWIVFQRRMDGTEDFYRGWNDYVNGFGEKDKEMWLGLETIHQLTKTGSYELRVDLGDFNGNNAYAKYGIFSIASASDKYRLTLGEYNGTAGDPFTYNNNSQFTTKDFDNDRNDVDSCAVDRKGAWWYNWCSNTNLNGVYFNYGKTDRTSIYWHNWRQLQSLKFTEMKFRLKT
ncbi:fibrinogen-like protein A [Styela clava]